MTDLNFNPPTSPARLTASSTLKLPRWALFLMCLLYILPGLVGRDPWKSEDAAGFGVMWTMATGAGFGGTTDWLVPNVAGAPIVEAGPLMFWVGALCIQLFGWAVDAAHAARLATVLFFLVAVTGIWYATYLIGRRSAAQPVALAFGGQPEARDYGRVLADGALLILLATIGLLIRAHESSSDVAMLAMLAVALYGMARSLDAPRLGTVWLAGALVGLVLSRGPGVAIAVLLLWCALIAFHADWRAARRSTVTVLLPLTAIGLSIWPALVYILVPDAGTHVDARLAYWGRYFDGIDSQAASKYVRTFPWSTWLAWPLAGWALWCWRARLSAAHIVLPGGFVLAMLASLCATSDTSDGQLLLVLPGLVMLAAFGLPVLRRGGANAFDWFSLMLYSVLALFIWFAWYAKMTGAPEAFARSIARLTPGFSPEFRPLVFVIALAATLGWLWIVRWRIVTHPKVLWRSVVLAAGGVTLSWMLLTTLFLHSINYSRTYRDVAIGLAAAMQASRPAAAQCVASDEVGLAQRASFAWFAGIRFSRLDYAGANIDSCSYLLRQDLARQKRTEALPPGRWKLIWEGRRASDRDERFRLYHKLGDASPAKSVWLSGDDEIPLRGAHRNDRFAVAHAS